MNAPLAQNLSPDTTLALIQAGQRDGTQQVAKLKGAQNIQQIEEAAREFEAVFITEMMKPMFTDTQMEAPFGGGKGEEIFQGLMLQEYGKLISQTGTIGLADQVKQEMIRLQQDAYQTQPTDITAIGADE